MRDRFRSRSPIAQHAPNCWFLALAHIARQTSEGTRKLDEYLETLERQTPEGARKPEEHPPTGDATYDLSLRIADCVPRGSGPWPNVEHVANQLGLEFHQSNSVTLNAMHPQGFENLMDHDDGGGILLDYEVTYCHHMIACIKTPSGPWPFWVYDRGHVEKVYDIDELIHYLLHRGSLGCDGLTLVKVRRATAPPLTPLERGSAASSSSSGAGYTEPLTGASTVLLAGTPEADTTPMRVLDLDGLEISSPPTP